jgi:hypothetical protein
MGEQALMDEVAAEIKAVCVKLEEVEAEIKQAQAEHNNEEVAALRKKEEQLRKEKEQLRKEKLLLLQRQPGALSSCVPRVHALTRVCLLADVHGAGSSNAGSERGSPPGALSALTQAPGDFMCSRTQVLRKKTQARSLKQWVLGLRCTRTLLVCALHVLALSERTMTSHLCTVRQELDWLMHLSWCLPQHLLKYSSSTSRAVPCSCCALSSWTQVWCSRSA